MEKNLAKLIIVSYVSKYPADFGYQAMVAIEIKVPLSKGFEILSAIEDCRENGCKEYRLSGEFWATNIYGEVAKLDSLNVLISPYNEDCCYWFEDCEGNAVSSTLNADVAEWLGEYGII